MFFQLFLDCSHFALRSDLIGQGARKIFYVVQSAIGVYQAHA